MKTPTRIFILVLLATSLSTQVSAQSEDSADHSVTSKSAEWTDHNNSDPGIAGKQDKHSSTLSAAKTKPDSMETAIPELQGIVVLCATEPESAQYRETWLDFIRRNQVKSSRLDRLIFTVINDAEAYRGNQRTTGSESPDEARERRAKTYNQMRKDALKDIRRRKKAD